MGVCCGFSRSRCRNQRCWHSLCWLPVLISLALSRRLFPKSTSPSQTQIALNTTKGQSPEIWSKWWSAISWGFSVFRILRNSYSQGQFLCLLCLQWQPHSLAKRKIFQGLTLYFSKPCYAIRVTFLHWNAWRHGAMATTYHWYITPPRAKSSTLIAPITFLCRSIILTTAFPWKSGCKLEHLCACRFSLS